MKSDTPTPQLRRDRARVMVLVDSLLVGGAERLAVDLAAAVDQSRFVPHVVVSRCSGPLEAVLRDSGVSFTVLNRRRRFSITAWRRALAIARRSDLIHSHKFSSNAWGALLARLSGTPLIAHEHNFAATPTRLRALIERRWIAPVARQIICVSESVATGERDMGISPHRLVVVPNGVMLTAAISRGAARAELALGDSDYVVGIVAQLRPEKAHEVLIEAASIIAERDGFRVCIVGSGPLEAALRNHCTQCGVDDVVVWAGEQPQAARLARAFDATVVCSDWEGMPLAALESMAAAVPVVGTRVGGLVDLLADDAGVLIAPRNAAELAQAIERLRRDPERAREIADRGMQRVRERHGFDHMVRSIQQIYDEALGPATATTVTPRSTRDEGAA